MMYRSGCQSRPPLRGGRLMLNNTYRGKEGGAWCG
jgi:hypothetical protein